MKILNVTKVSVKATIATRLWDRMQQKIRHPQSRSAIAKVLSYFRESGKEGDKSNDYSILKNSGILLFPNFIGREEIFELREALSQFDCFDPWRVNIGKFKHNDIPSGTHVAQIEEAPRLERLHEIAKDPRIVSVATQYFGCKPILDSIQAWWSVSGNDQPEEAENFHRDNDSIRFLKFFIYATDVNEENGPHIFVEGSHIDNILTEHRRLSDEEVRNAFGESRLRVMTGNAGDAFLEDTFGIHKGQLPIVGKRLLIQFRYSITETIFRSPLLVSMSPKTLPTSITSLLHD